MNRERRIGLALLVGAVFVILAVIAVVVSRESSALHYTLVFKNAEGLQPGDRVLLDGVNIGVVKWVQRFAQPPRIHVRVKIDPQYASHVSMNSTAIIRYSSMVSGQKMLEIHNAGGEVSKPMPRNAIVNGVESSVDLMLWKGRNTLHGGADAANGFIESMRDQIHDLSRNLGDLASGPEARKALDELRAFMGRLKNEGRESLAKLQQQWPAIKERVVPVLKQLEQTGRQHVAAVIRQAMDWIEKTLAEWRRQPNPPAEAPAGQVAGKVT